MGHGPGRRRGTGRDRAADGLSALVQRSLPTVEAAIETGLRRPRRHPAAPAHRDLRRSPVTAIWVCSASWADLATRRPQAIWVLVPQLVGSTGALIDQRPIPLAAPGQFFALDADWIDARSRPLSAEGVS